MSDVCNNIFDDVREHKYDCYPRVVADSVCDVNQELCPKMEPKQEFMMEDPNLTAPPKAAQMMNQATLASVALLTESEAARVFNMGTTRFKARCRSLGIQRWPHRKLMSLKNLYYDLTLHLKRAFDDHNIDLVVRVKHWMNEIKSYATMLEGDLSLLNKFYNGKKAWPDNILKIRQTIYKKRHAQVMVDKKRKAALNVNDEKEAKTSVHWLKKRKYDKELSEDDSASEEDGLDLYLNDNDIIKTDDDERIWWFLALGEENAHQEMA